MKKLISILLVFTVLLPCFSMVSFAEFGTTYYVDSISGDDSNSGLAPDSAWKTTDKASEKTYSAGDKILFKTDGVYSGNFFAKGSGTKENPITITSYGDGYKPILTSNTSDAIINIIDVSGWLVSDIEITTPTGTGILIGFLNRVVSDITVKSCVLHDINNFPNADYNASKYAAIRLLGNSFTAGAHNENILIDDCEIYNCGYGMISNGNWPGTPDKPLDKNIVVENCNFHNLQDDAFIMGRADTIILRNSSVINTCLSVGIYYTAPVWMWGVTNGLVENCEIAGAENVLDGMAVDFDAYVSNSVYQYIYSHDNCRFMHNIPTEDHVNNTVRYCLSVNDNKSDNNGGPLLGSPERNFKFYNNTIVNGREFRFIVYENSLICNNIFSLIPGEKMSISKSRENNIFTNNCYYGTTPILSDKNAIFGYPGFAGTDYTDKDSFKLLKSSPCIGAGIQAEEDMGKHDFYGNPLTDTHNIGCYEGEGVDGEDTTPSVFDEIIRFFDAILQRVDVVLNNFYYDVANFFEKIKNFFYEINKYIS